MLQQIIRRVDDAHSDRAVELKKVTDRVDFVSRRSSYSDATGHPVEAMPPTTTEERSR